MAGMRFDLTLLLLAFGSVLFLSTVSADLVISKLDRRFDLSSPIVRATTSLKVENNGAEAITEFLLPFPENQAKNLASLSVIIVEGKGKSKVLSESLPVRIVNPMDSPPSLVWYSVTLPKELVKGGSLNLEIKAILTNILRPFPEKITQADVQLIVFQDSAHVLSPYAVHMQSLTVKLPEPKVESYTKLENTKFSGSEIKYGPYANQPPFTYTPLAVHYVSNKPFVVARELVREIEISHWGNVQVTENYNLVHAGAVILGEFSRLEYQAQPHLRGASAFRHLIAKLPARAHSIYYRDDIGNISTSHVWGDSSRTVLEIEPRFPMFGGWKTTFTIGYGLPLKDFLFKSGGERFLSIPFGSPIDDLVIDNLTVKIVLPEGSKFSSVSVPFPAKQSMQEKISHLDVVGRPVVVLEKTNVVPEHSQYFQVHYKFSNLSLLQEPLLLVFGYFLLFVACIAYVRADFTISKSSSSYLAKLHWDEVRSTIQQFESIMNRCLIVHDKLQASLRDLSRTGDLQACKAARKTADSTLKELLKDLKPLISFLQSSPQAAQILPKVEELVAKEKELQEKIMQKHSIVVESYDKKSGSKDTENRVTALEQKIVLLRQEVDDLVDTIDEI